MFHMEDIFFTKELSANLPQTYIKAAKLLLFRAYVVSMAQINSKKKKKKERNLPQF